MKSNQMLVFEERGKPEYPERNLSKQSREPINSAHLWHRVGESNPGHIGGRRVLSPLRQPCSPRKGLFPSFLSEPGIAKHQKLFFTSAQFKQESLLMQATNKWLRIKKFTNSKVTFRLIPFRQRCLIHYHSLTVVSYAKVLAPFYWFM